MPANIEVVTLATPVFTDGMAGRSPMICSPVNFHMVADGLSVEHRPHTSAANEQPLLMQSRSLRVSADSVLMPVSNELSATSS